MNKRVLPCFLILLLGYLVTAPAYAGWFEDTWPGVFAQIKKLSGQQEYQPVECVPGAVSESGFVPEISFVGNDRDRSLQNEFSMRMEHAGSRNIGGFIKTCWPVDLPVMTVYYRPGEILAYGQLSAQGGDKILKEWIYADSPNAPEGSCYQWRMMGDHHTLNPRQDGSIAIGFKKGYQIAVIEPVKFWDRYDNAFDGELSSDGSQVTVRVKAGPGQYPLRIDPTVKYNQWLGGKSGGGTAVVNAAAYSSTSNAVLVAGNVAADGILGLSVSMGGQYSGSSEGFVMEILDGGTPTLNWGQWLGGDSNEDVLALAVNGSTIYVGGSVTSSTSFETVTFQGTLGAGGIDGFVVKMQDGGTPTLNWGYWVGGAGADAVLGLAVNGSTVYAGGYTVISTSWETVTFRGTLTAGGTDGFVVEIIDGGTPTLNWGHWLGGSGVDRVNAVAVNGSTMFAGGYAVVSTSWETVTFRGTFSAGASEGFVVEIIDGGTPTLNWGQWLGSQDWDRVNALAVNGSSIFVGGTSISSVSWETVTFYGTLDPETRDLEDGFVIKILDGGTPTLAWAQWLGAARVDTLDALVVNGSSIFAAGIVDDDAASEVTYLGTLNGLQEGWVMKITDGGTPTVNWGWMFGGSSSETAKGLAVNSGTIYVGGLTPAVTTWTTVTFQGTNYGGSAGYVLEIIDGGTPVLRWGQWLGTGTVFSESAQVNAVAVNGSTIFAGGYTAISGAWDTVTFRGTFSPGSTEAFVVEIKDGSAPTLNWGQWLGGAGVDAVYALAVNGTKIYAGGYTVISTSWETVTFRGTMGAGGTEGFVVEIIDGGTPTLNWGQRLGGAGVDVVNALAVSGSTIYAGGYTVISTSWETVTFQGTLGAGGTEGFVVEIITGGTPTLNWGQRLGGADVDVVNALAVNGSTLYAGGYTVISTSWETVTFRGTLGAGGTEGFVVELIDGGTPTLNWGQWLGGAGVDVVNALAVSGSTIYAGGYTVISTSWETVTFQGTLGAGGTEGFVVEIIAGGTPTLNWGQWLGGADVDVVNALAVNGSSVYAGGYTVISTSWETVTFQGTLGAGGTEGFIIGIIDGGTPTVNWGQWLGGDGVDVVKALALNGITIYAGGYSVVSTSWETLTFRGTFSSGSEGFVFKIEDAVAAPAADTNIFFDMLF